MTRHHVLVTLPVNYFYMEPSEEPDAYTVHHDGQEFVGNTLDLAMAKTLEYAYPEVPAGYERFYSLNHDYEPRIGPGTSTSSGFITIRPARPKPEPTKIDKANAEIIGHLTPDFYELEEKLPYSFTETQMLTELHDDDKGKFISITAVDNETVLHGTLVNFHSDYMHPDCTHIIGKTTLFLENGVSATFNLYDRFTTYDI